MRGRRLLWQLFFSYLVIMLLTLVASAILASRTIRESHFRQTTEDLADRAMLITRQIEPVLRSGRLTSIDALCKELGRTSGTRITVILPDGEVVGDSEKDPALMEPHTGLGRPEIASALEGIAGNSKRYSQTLRRSMVYRAIPITRTEDDRAQVIGIVRASLAVASVREALRDVYLQIAIGAIVVGLLAALGSWMISRRIARPLEQLRQGALAYARGELDRRLPVPELAEVGTLAESMNQMAGELDARIQMISRQRNEQEAILRSMTEGVLAVDTDLRVVSMNEICGDILNIDLQHIRGKTIQEVLRNPTLQALVQRALSAPGPVEGDVVLREPNPRNIQVRGSILHDAQNQQIGAVLVLNDITRLQKLESVRRDFVANVSHELKTPITSIKAAVETLQDGAMASPESAERFLGMVVRQADRLDAIIEDLLSLSRIEQGSERCEVELEVHHIEPVLLGAVQVCEAKAVEREVTLATACDSLVRTRINPALLENAVVNLIDNATKFSAPGGIVHVEGTELAQEIVISVQDHGCGIHEEHLPRIFERFYRVDKGRNGALGGTGLGLAIVKHIATAHGGTVTVESTYGVGSTFRMHLPRTQSG